MTVKLATTARNAAAKAVTDLLDAGATGGSIQIRTGTRPTDPQAASTGTTLLATIALSKPAGGAPATGVVTITDPAAVSAVATGTATWARFVDANGVAVLDCDVTATGGGGDLTLSTTSLSSGVTVDFSAITYTQPQ